MDLTKIESLIYEAPARDDGGLKPLEPTKTDNLMEQSMVRSALEEITYNTSTLDLLEVADVHLLDNTDGNILKYLAQSAPWEDMMMLVKDVADSFVGSNGNKITAIEGPQDRQRMMAIMERLRFISRGLGALGRNQIEQIDVRSVAPEGTQRYPIPADNTLIYRIIPKLNIRGIDEIIITSRGIPESKREARFGIDIRGKTSSGIPTGGIISLDHGVKDTNYGPHSRNVRPKIDFRLGKYDQVSMLQGMKFELNNRHPNLDHHFQLSTWNRTNFDQSHQMLRDTFNGLHRYNNDPRTKGKRIFSK